MTLILLIALTVIAAIIWLNVEARANERDGKWHHHNCLGKHTMRRWRNDGWEYRAETDSEEFQRFVDDAR